MSKSATEIFKNARIGVIGSVMEASGWNLNMTNADMAIESSVFFYVVSHPDGWSWMCSVPKTTFHEGAKALSRVNVDDAVANVNGLIRLRQVPTKAQAPDWDQAMATGLIAYITKTQTYKMSANATKTSHFVVLRYSKTETLRPYAVGGSDRFAQPSDFILGGAKQVVAMDAVRHPDWLVDK